MGGIIHTIDKVLTIPYTVPATITRAGLNDLVALLSANGWLTDPAVLATVTDLHDLTLYDALKTSLAVLTFSQLRLQ
jgi:hypothetical protein